MNWFQRQASKWLNIPTRTDPVPRETIGMTLAAWRKDQRLMEHALQLRGNRVYRAQLEVLRVEHPGHRVYNEASRCERILGRIEGFQLCLDMLDAFAIPLKTKEAEEATFEAIEPTEKDNV